MPPRPRTPCTVPGCPARAEQPGRCPVHAAQRTRTRRVETRQQYGGAWPARRRAFLTAHPYCALCGRLAEIADHWPRTRRQLLRDQVPDPDHERHLRPLCAPCHNRHTGLEQPGGWHAQRL